MKQVKPMALTISLVISTGFSLYLSFSSTAKAISDKLFSMVIFIIKSSSNQESITQMAAGFPENTFSVNTSTTYCFIKIPS